MISQFHDSTRRSLNRPLFASFSTRDPHEATNSDWQFYRSGGDTFGVLLLPLVSSAISLAAATLNLSSATVSHVLYTFRIGHSRSEARELLVDSRRPFRPPSPSQGAVTPAYHTVHACCTIPRDRKSLLLRAHNMISF